MIEEIFADTSGLVALGNEDDIAETLTRLLFDTHHKNAVAFGEMLFSSKNIEIIYIDIIIL